MYNTGDQEQEPELKLPVAPAGVPGAAGKLKLHIIDSI